MIIVTATGPRVLLVDDDADALFLFEEVLRHRRPDCVLVSAPDGAGAVASLANGPSPSVVLLDVNLPDGDGIDVLRRLRADPATRELPVVMWTGEVNPVVRDEARALGVSWFVKKPSDLDALDAFVDRLLALGEGG